MSEIVVDIVFWKKFSVFQQQIVISELSGEFFQKLKLKKYNILTNIDQQSRYINKINFQLENWIFFRKQKFETTGYYIRIERQLGCEEDPIQLHIILIFEMSDQTLIY